MKLPGFIGPAYKLGSLPVDCQECINLYPENNERQTGKNGEPATLVGTPGLRELADLNNGKRWRGLHTAPNGILYGVAGDKVYRINSDWTTTALGWYSSGNAATLNSSEGYVQFADFGFGVVISHSTDKNWGSLVTIRLVEQQLAQGTTTEGGRVPETASIEQIPAGGFQSYSVVTKNQRVLVAAYQLGSSLGGQIPGKIFYSDLSTMPPVFTAGNVLSAEYARDVVTHLAVSNDYVWIGGENSLEVFQVTTDPNIPFVRVQGAVSDVGVVGRSFVNLADQLFWVGRERQGGIGVYMANGFKGQRISDLGVETALASYDTVDDVVGWGYSEKGHSFLVYSFPSANKTWVYDVTTGGWHERLSYNKTPGEGGVLGRYRAGCHAYAYGVHVVGDYDSGKLYALEDDHYLDAGLPILRQRTSPHVSADLKKVFHHKFQLDAEFGVGLDGTGQGTDPVVEYQYSNDGGFSWSNWRTGSLGKIGARMTRAIWRMLGSARDRVHRIRISDPVKVRIISTDIDVSVGNG